jgi:hypothetical protein
MTNMAARTGAFSDTIAPTFQTFRILQTGLAGKPQTPKHRQNGDPYQKKGDNFYQHPLHPKTGKGGAFLNAMGDVSQKRHAKS